MEAGISEVAQDGESEPIHVLDEWDGSFGVSYVRFAIATHDEIPGWLGMWQENKSGVFYRKLFGGVEPSRGDVESEYFQWKWFP